MVSTANQKERVVQDVIAQWDTHITALERALGEADELRITADIISREEALHRASVSLTVDGKNAEERAARLQQTLAEDDAYLDIQDRLVNTQARAAQRRIDAAILEHRITLCRKAADMYAALFRGES